MATTRGQVRAAIDLVAKRKLQKLDGNDVIFEASGSLASGKVTINVPFSGSTVVVTGSGGLVVNNGGVTINNNTGLVVNSNGITVNSGGASITGDLVAGANSVGSLISRVGTQLTGSTSTSGSLTVGGNGALTANNGATINGSALTANAGLVVNNSALMVTNGGISGSATLQAGGNLTVGGNALLKGNLDVEGNMIVRGQPTIINTEVLEVKDNIVVINKLSGSEAAYDSATGGLYVNRGNFETASLLWVSSSNDWQLQSSTGGTLSGADLVVNKLKPVLISGSTGVSVNSALTIAATASLHTSASFTNVTIPTSSVTVEGVTYKTFNIDTAFHAIDSALANAGLSATDVQNAYTRLRYQASGNFDANGFAEIPLPVQVSSVDAFPISSFNYITADVMIKSSGRWINDLVAVEMVISGTSNDVIHVLIDAPALGSSDEYRLMAINNDPAKFVV